MITCPKCDNNVISEVEDHCPNCGKHIFPNEGFPKKEEEEYFIALLDDANRVTLYWNDGKWEKDISDAVSWVGDPWSELLEIQRIGHYDAYVAIKTAGGTMRYIREGLTDLPQLAGIGLAVPTPQWVQEKRMDTFSRAISTYHEGVDEIHFAKWCVNEFDKFFETGLAKEEEVKEPEVSEITYKAVIESDTYIKNEMLYSYKGFVCVTDKEGKQTIVKDLPVEGQGVDIDIAMQNFRKHADEIVEKLKIEGRFG